ncbi:MAG TPA: helix-turn-helix domain-containing protein [Candidatus Eremiobacteraceae bacterium]|nr:helix-turn-helix domain-containing protein [Candidatus Eremiobacteraceae bacterium]
MRKTKTTPLSGFCPRYHRAVELIGRRWSGAIIRSLLGGKRRFSEIGELVPGVSDRLLTERLRELEDVGIVRREVDGGPPLRVDYALTASGAELDSTVRALADWAERWMPATPRAKRLP